MVTHRVRASPDVRASVSGDGLVLLDIGGGLVLTSNPIGARIWQLIEQRCTCLEIARQLAEDYEVPVEHTERDVVAFVDALLRRGLVTEASTC